jgi:hypothetical protein
MKGDSECDLQAAFKVINILNYLFGDIFSFQHCFFYQNIGIRLGRYGFLLYQI